MGTKRSALTDENGLPLSVVISGANTHDIKLPGETLDHIVVPHPKPDEKHPQNLKSEYGKFEFETPKNTRDVSGIEDKIIPLSARGLTTREINYKINT